MSPKKDQPKKIETAQPSMDDVLRRMLSSPPKQHKDQRVNPKPAGKPAQKKAAK